MTILWCVAAVAVVIAGLALVSARRATAAATRLSESYWQLRYEHGQLASRLERVEAQLAGRPVEDDPVPAHKSATSFVPLASLKR